MPNVRIPMAVCAAVAEVLSGSHATLDALFEAAGAPGPPPDAPHHSKWKTWLFRAGNDPSVDSLAVLGNLIEEFMDLPPKPDACAVALEIEDETTATYVARRDRLNGILEEHGFQYFRGGRVMPRGTVPATPVGSAQGIAAPETPTPSAELGALLQRLIRGLPRAMYPLTNRRRGAQQLTFDSEYDIQDLLHSHLRPWVADIRPEEHTPSYAGSSTRMDFLLPAHRIVIEVKRVRDARHAAVVASELIIDIEHYARHPDCSHLWCVVYDPNLLIANPSGFASDLEGERRVGDASVSVRVVIVST